MADDVRNEILAASRSRTGNKDLHGPASSRRFSQVKAAFDVSPTSVSPERSFVGKPRSRQSSSSPTRRTSTTGGTGSTVTSSQSSRSPPAKSLDIPTAALVGVVGKRWNKQEDKQTHTDRFKNSRALFEKLEKENSAPLKPTTFKTGTAFGSKAKDGGPRGGIGDRRGFSDRTSYSAGAAQVRRTSDLLRSLNDKQENGTVSANGSGSSEKLDVNGAAPIEKDSGSVTSTANNGELSSKPKDRDRNISDELSDSEVFIEPKSEPAISSHRHMFNRKLSSDVLPKPYHAPSSNFEIRPVKRPTSTSRQDSHENGETTSTEKLPRFPSKSTPVLEKSLSKDDIAASLAAADKYLNKIHSDSSINEISNDDPPPWKSRYSQHKYVEPAEKIEQPERKESALPDTPEDTNDTDESAPYDNVADVLSELQASGHVKASNNTQHDYNKLYDKSWGNTADSNTEDRVTYDSPYTVPDSFSSRLQEYDSVASTQSVYLESKLEHTYSNVGFKDNKKPKESNSDDEPYEPVAPPTPPSRRHPANLPLAEEVEPETMSAEEAENLLSINRQRNLVKEAMPDLTITEIEKMFDAVADPMSVHSGRSINVDGSDLENEPHYDDDDAETASLHSNSTDGGGAYATLNVNKPEVGDVDSEDRGHSVEPYPPSTRVTFLTNMVQVFDTYSAEEYDRHNEFIDPVAASAEYELEKRIEKMDVFPVDIVKGSEGLGLSIIGMGVGADTGLEKLGIFIKNLFPGGAAQKDGRMQVNDQIIEVGDKSLVGVSQQYAATVLRNTSGSVRFLIGREKNPGESEVARLIEQSIAEDKIRDDMRQRQQEAARQHLLERQQRQRARQHLLNQNSSTESRDEKESPESEGTHEDPPPLPVKGYSSTSSSDRAKSAESYATNASANVQGFDTSSEEGSIPPVSNGHHSHAHPLPDPPTDHSVELAEVLANYKALEEEINLAKDRLTMMEEVESDRDMHRERCAQLEAQLEISQKIVDTQEAALAAKEEERQEMEKKYIKAKKIIKEHEQKNTELSDQVRTLKSKISRLEEDNRHIYSSNSASHEGIEAFVDSENESLGGDVDAVDMEGPKVSIEDMNIAGNQARPLLDNSHLKLRSHLAHGAVAKRRPPSKVSSTVFKENDKNSNNIPKNIPPALPKFIVDDRKIVKNLHPIAPSRRKVKTPTREMPSDDSDTSSGIFGGQRNDGNVATEIDHNPRGGAGGGIMLIATKPLQDSASNSVSTSREDMIGSMSSLEGSLNSTPYMIHCYTWNLEQVGQWLHEIGLPQLSHLFMQNNIDGKSLLLLDSTRIKQIGVSTKEKTVLKKKLKELRANYDKERKQMEKDQKSKSPVTKKKSKSLFARF